VVAGGVALQLYGAPARLDHRREAAEDERVGRRPRRWWKALAVASLWTAVGAGGAYVFVSARTATENDGGSGAAGSSLADEGTHRATAPATHARDTTSPASDRSGTKTRSQPHHATAPRTRAPDRPVQPAAGSPPRREKRQPHRPPPARFPTRVFVWPPVPRAAFYKVEFFRHGARIFIAWPSRTRLLLPLRWTYHGRPFRLTRATYHWRVTPAFGSRSRPRYGIPSTRSTVVLR
jgi:hypothetical protein